MSHQQSEERARIVTELNELLVGILGLAAGTELDVEKPMYNMGLDSLLAMDLLTALDGKYKIALEQSAYVYHPTIQLLAAHVVEIRNRGTA